MGVQTAASPVIKSETVVVPLWIRLPLVELRKLVLLSPREFQALAVHTRVDVLDELLKVNVQSQLDLPSRVQFLK